MKTILPALLYNMEMIGCIMILLVMAFSANTILGTAKSSIVHKNFNWKVLLRGFIKGIMILLGIFLVTSVVSMVPPIFEMFDITIINSEVLQSISIVAVLIPIVYALIYYIQGAIEKIAILFDVQPLSENGENDNLRVS